VLVRLINHLIDSRRQHQIPQEATRVGNDFVQTAGWVRDLGIYLDSEASMKIHVSRTVSSCFSVLRQLRSIRRSVTRSVLQSLGVSLVLSRLDYGNATPAGLPGREFNRLQSPVAECCCTTCFAASKYDHVTPLLCDLHWLRVPERIDFKIAVLVYRCLHGLALAYLSTELQSVKDIPSRQRLRSWSSDTLVVPTSRLSTVGDRAFPVIAARVGTLCLWTLSRRLLCQLSSDCSRLNVHVHAQLDNGIVCHGAFLMHDTAPAAHDYLNCLSDFRRDIVMWSCSYLAYAT